MHQSPLKYGEAGCLLSDLSQAHFLFHLSNLLLFRSHIMLQVVDLLYQLLYVHLIVLQLLLLRLILRQDNFELIIQNRNPPVLFLNLLVQAIGLLKKIFVLIYHEF